MLENLSNLYQELIIEHSRNPRNIGVLSENSGKKMLGINPSCGDKLLLSVEIEDGILKNIKHESTGCAIFLATSSLMSSTLKGFHQNDAKDFIQLFMEQILDRQKDFSDQDKEILGKLLVFANVSQYPARVKCATLFPRTLDYLIKNYHSLSSNDVVSTE